MFNWNIISCLIAILLVKRNAGDFRTHPNWPKHVDEICGESNHDRIIGGENASLGQFPWMVRLVYFYRDMNSLVVNCGGTLISDQYVLSAAHCLGNFHFLLTSVILGEFDTETDPDCIGDICAAEVQRINIARIIRTPKFTKDTQEDDILLIQLETPAKLNGWVMPICLPTGSEIFDTFGETAGWGWTTPNQTHIARVLQYVKIPIVDMSECIFITYPTNETNQICAGSRTLNQDSCAGDSGGPFMQLANSEHGPRYYLVGIVSFGPIICGTGPGVYTKVTAYMPFVLDGMGIK